MSLKCDFLHICLNLFLSDNLWLEGALISKPLELVVFPCFVSPRLLRFPQFVQSLSSLYLSRATFKRSA